MSQYRQDGTLLHERLIPAMITYELRVSENTSQPSPQKILCVLCIDVNQIILYPNPESFQVRTTCRSHNYPLTWNVPVSPFMSRPVVWDGGLIRSETGVFQVRWTPTPCPGSG